MAFPKDIECECGFSGRGHKNCNDFGSIIRPEESNISGCTVATF